MANFDSRFSSKKQAWKTPRDLFDRLDAEFHFEVDLAADAKNKLCPRYFSAKDDALKKPWSGVCWLNPPYGEKGKSKLSDWVKKAYHETRDPGTTVVMLIPARTNTRWFHTFCMEAAELRFVDGRPKFGDAPHGLPQPLVLVVFRYTTEPTKLLSFKL